MLYTMAVIVILAAVSGGITLYQAGRDTGRLEVWRVVHDGLQANTEQRTRNEIGAQVEGPGVAAMYSAVTDHVARRVSVRRLLRAANIPARK